MKMLSKTEKESTPEEVLDSIEKLQQHLKPCKNCTHGIRAEKPFAEMKNVKLTPLTEKVLKQTAKQFKIKEKSCLLCLSIKNFC